MRNYTFKLFINENPYSEGYGMGNNAIEAFEAAIEVGDVSILYNEEFKVLAESDSGLSIQFTVMRS